MFNGRVVVFNELLSAMFVERMGGPQNAMEGGKSERLCPMGRHIISVQMRVQPVLEKKQNRS